MRHAYAFLIALCLLPAVHAQDWPQWLGPQRTGAIDAVIKPWTGPFDVAWRVPVGEGHSSPIVAAGMVFLHSKASGTDEEIVTAWGLDGKERWHASNTRAAFSSQFGAGPRATPAYSAGKLYTFGVTGILICRDASTGKELWKKELLTEFGAKNLFFGASSSPLVDDKHVYVMPGGEKGSIVAFNKENGELVWTSGKDKASYASPMMTTFANKPTLVFQTERGVVGLDPARGDEYFRIPLKDLLNESSTTPVRVGDILFASSVTFGSMGIKVNVVDNKLEARQAWRNTKLTCYFATPVEMGGMLYAVTGELARRPTATLHCVDPKTGKSTWNKPGVGTYHATLYPTKDKLLLLEEKGDLVLIEAATDSYKELCRGKLCNETWAHPAYAQGMLFARDAKELIAIKLK